MNPNPMLALFPALLMSNSVIARARAAAVADLDRLDQSILARAFSGILVPQGPADRPIITNLTHQSAVHHKRLGLANPRG